MIILIQCADRVGLVAAISKVMADAAFNIISMREYVNVEANRFYLRVEVADNGFDTLHIEAALQKVLPPGSTVYINTAVKKNVAVLVTKEYHCLGDILLRNYFNTLGASVACVIGNHETLRSLTEKFDIPFHYVDHQDRSKESFEAALSGILSHYRFDYIILAKFMRILSPQFVATYPHRVINIHHSFLPAFIGASPYRQAYERGVKLIGATAHFVTDVLDEGPIITQQIIPVNHAHSVKDMITLGKEIEESVLAKALQLVLQDRVIVDGNKTVVFEN
ncbi:formyltetrahydrofolate deformylase [Niabella drilacis]|uniref:Formyltetrahydrofolate deformylase n=1 Tax=Niabella drilacis (strain DSM 25811 / CCM 8410 / CCUG 62505 / LMG 26954 / E90) TaxID=1285928 RepID=A0A1G6M285_NIADE|nr:formyltetrahydrofolate deformylase [Niabella drilacis]SDC49589.1 formyltetrahydrofolate deformylase [Niabella drilacis]